MKYFMVFLALMFLAGCDFSGAKKRKEYIIHGCITGCIIFSNKVSPHMPEVYKSCENECLSFFTRRK